MYDNLSSFIIKLQDLLRFSTLYNAYENITGSNKKEFESINRLKNKCEELKIDFKIVENRINPIDCLINYNNIQCKSSSKKYSKTKYFFGWWS